jgi:SWI/SNF-related matrix-associated actin-dependent regulator of chromatin subfamily A-like protein 1
VNPSLELMPFQAEGATWLASMPRALLIWDMGIGKTPTAIRACLLASAAKILVYCPPIAVGVWRQHFRDWGEDGWDVRIVPYSQAAKFLGQLIDYGPFDVVILDECQKLKNPDAQRTRAVYGVKIDLEGSPLHGARHIWALSGTPVLNHAGEFWSHFFALAPQLIGRLNYPKFIDRYCLTRATPYGIHIVGSRNSFDLNSRILPLVNRKRIKDVLIDLPSLRIVEHPLPDNPALARHLRDELAETLSLDQFTDIDRLDDEALLAAVQTGSVAFSTARRLIGKAKIESVAELVDDCLDDALDDKLIVFVHHREVIEGLAGRLAARYPLVIHGGTPQRDRERAIDAFQNDDDRRLIILAIEAAGESITLHAAHHVIIAEPSPVPAKNAQAIARAHRKGQKNPVLARFVLLPGTLDARLMRIIARKTRDIAAVVDGTYSQPHLCQLETIPNMPDIV